MWSPEDLLVASVASCYMLTLEGIAAHRGVTFRGVDVEAVGHLTRRAEGRFGFVVVELRVDLVVDQGCEDRAERVARTAKQSCLVAHALDVPVELELTVRAAPLRPDERPLATAQLSST
jgi:organic hydroperoxide reductase OsmC/OhrA